MATDLGTYETAASVAAALPEAEREMFAALLADLTEPYPLYRVARRASAVRRWLKDAGWLAR